MKYILLLSFFIVSYTFEALADEFSVKFYVAPDGSDNNDGTLENPFLTLERARDAVRLVNQSMTGDIAVYLRGGEYNLTQTIEFGPNDSGADGYTVHYINYPGETPVISSSQKIEGWTQTTVNDIAAFTTNVGSLRFRDIFINDKRALRARTESYFITAWHPPYPMHPPFPPDPENWYFSITGDAADDWQLLTNTAAAQKVEAVMNTHWIESYTRLDRAVDVVGQSARVYLDRNDIPGLGVFNRLHPDRSRVNQTVHFENALVFMDQPGEWFLDEDTGNLYYIPMHGETIDNINAVVGTLETLVNISGTMGNRVKNIRFSGITFAYTTFKHPIENNGIIFGQGGTVGYIDESNPYRLIGAEYTGTKEKKQPAAIQLQGADNITFERNIIKHTGATAIYDYYMTDGNKYIGNVLFDIAGNGIHLGVHQVIPPGFNHENTNSLCKNHIIKNNYLKKIGTNHYSGTGIILGYTNGVTIEHNDVSDVPYSAIAAGWDWSDRLYSQGDTKINHNNIYNFVNRISDGGGIYTLGNTPLSQINNNYVHDSDRNHFTSDYPLVSIYLDGRTTGYTVRNNVLTRVSMEFYHNAIEGANTLINNNTQNESVKRDSGVEPQYWDLIPGYIRQSGEDWIANTYGGVRIYCTATGTGTISKNGETVHTVNASNSGTPFLLNIDVSKGDKITFSNNANWDVHIKPEVYIPRLVVTGVEHEAVIDPRYGEPFTVNDRYKTVVIRVKAGTDLDNFRPNFITPPGTVWEDLNEGSSYKTPHTLRIWMEEGSEFLSFASERKYKDCNVQIVQVTVEEGGNNNTTNTEEDLHDRRIVYVYPNPTKGTFLIDFQEYNNMDNVRVMIYNLQGNLLQHIEKVENSRKFINLAPYPPGIYILQVIDGNIKDEWKIVKE